MGITEALALLQAALTLIPQAEAAGAVVRKMVAGQAITDADVDTLLAVTAALNAQADQAERAAGATGA